MKIIKYSKKGSNKYRVYLDDNTSILLHEDVILKNNLLIKKEINDIDELLKQNKKYEILDVSIKYISLKTRCINEMYDYLKKKEYDEDDIERTINYLIDKNYLNDKIYSRNYIMDRINLSNDGKNKIIKFLESQNIGYDDYSEYLDLLSKDVIYSKINKYIDKMIKTNKKSKFVLKNKIMINLINLGYDREDINYCLDNSFNVDDNRNKEIESQKLYNKLKRKYSGEELDRKVREKLYQRGYFE